MVERLKGRWASPEPGGLTPKGFVCGHCNERVSSVRGYTSHGSDSAGKGYTVATVAICPHCNRPTFFEGGDQTPGVPFGEVVQYVPDNVLGLYDEARKSTTVGAYTPAVMAARKLLMNVAVDKGAKGNLRFVEYVDYLSEKGYIPPDGKEWVTKIKDRGNEANHEIIPMTRRDAELILGFAGMLLKFAYELPGSLESA